MSAQALQLALSEIGVRGEVEARNGLALLRLRGPELLRDVRLREATVALALAHGFTHLALELLDEAVDGDAPVHRA